MLSESLIKMPSRLRCNTCSKPQRRMNGGYYLQHGSIEMRDPFIANRQWKSLAPFWFNVVANPLQSLPHLAEDDKFGVTDLRPIRLEARKESNFNTRRFALRVGYVGTMFNGYESKTLSTHRSVEGDLKSAAGYAAYGAGRTGRYVSAISQVVTMSCQPTDSPEKLVEKMRQSEPVLSGRLAVYDCLRVPNSFSAPNSVMWRRYFCMVPLNVGNLSGFDIDVNFVNEAFQR
jgi:hypothetical protein